MSGTKALVDFVTKRLQYIELISQSGVKPGTPKYAQLRVDCCAAIMQYIKTSRCLTVDCVVDVNAALVAKPMLSEESVALIMQALDAKVNMASTTMTGVPNSDSKQNNLNIDNYLSADLWKCFEDAAISKENKIFAMAKVFVSIGLVRPNAKTFSYGSAIATQAHGFEVTQMLADTRRLKDLFRHIAG